MKTVDHLLVSAFETEGMVGGRCIVSIRLRIRWIMRGRLGKGLRSGEDMWSREGLQSKDTSRLEKHGGETVVFLLGALTDMYVGMVSVWCFFDL